MLDLLEPFTVGFQEDDALPPSPKEKSDPQKRDATTHLDDSPQSMVTDAEKDTLAKSTKSKKGLIDSHSRGSHKVFARYPKGPKFEVSKMIKSPRARCKIKPAKCVHGITPST